jgi:hypothetical protein
MAIAMAKAKATAMATATATAKATATATARKEHLDASGMTYYRVDTFASPGPTEDPPKKLDLPLPRLVATAKGVLA